jgi:hypothetical protein
MGSTTAIRSGSGVVSIETRPPVSTVADIAPHVIEPAVTSQSDDVVFDWQSARPFAIMTRALIVAGYDSQEAADGAANWVRSHSRIIEGREVFQLDWANGRLFPMLMDLFHSLGVETQESADMADDVMDAWGLSGDSTDGGDPCVAQTITIFYCTGNPLRKHKTTRVVDAGCFGEIENCPESSQCIWPNDYEWWAVTFKEGCSDLTLSGKCIWIGDPSAPFTTDCENVDFGCECFEEADPELDCDEIERECGSEQWGPSGCPDCD